MGITYAEITLSNIKDEGYAQGGYISEKDIRTTTVTAVVDTGAISLVLTEDIFEKLGLVAVGKKIVKTANGQRVTARVTDAVKIQWKDRFWTVHAMVIPGAESVLLGAIPLEGLDLMVNPVTQELVGIHGDQVEWLVL